MTDPWASPPPPRSPSRAPRTSVAAVVSLLFGIAAWTVLPFVGALVAVFCGHMARATIHRSGGTVDGDAMAVAGLVLGWLQLALIGLVVLLVFAVLGYGFSGWHEFHWLVPLQHSLPAHGQWV
ncbi:MAG TPA: DUF4190 domain-containing protein [Nevskiaceae bacterium]|nr:DUF4190 domain-containing protein [Nevskiaceae bacterium]